MSLPNRFKNWKQTCRNFGQWVAIIPTAFILGINQLLQKLTPKFLESSVGNIIGFALKTSAAAIALTFRLIGYAFQFIGLIFSPIGMLFSKDNYEYKDTAYTSFLFEDREPITRSTLESDEVYMRDYSWAEFFLSKPVCRFAEDFNRRPVKQAQSFFKVVLDSNNHVDDSILSPHGLFKDTDTGLISVKKKIEGYTPEDITPFR